MKVGRVVVAALSMVGSVAVIAQEKEDRTLLTQEQMTSIINEASGERAMHNVLDLVAYQRVRSPEEYKGHFRESDVMAAKAKEYGFTNVTISNDSDQQCQSNPSDNCIVTGQDPAAGTEVEDPAAQEVSLVLEQAGGRVASDGGYASAATSSQPLIMESWRSWFARLR